jgi:hypothetical protein
MNYTYPYDEFDYFHINTLLENSDIKLITYELSPYVDVIVEREENTENVKLYLKVCEYKLYTLIVHPETIPDYFYQFKYDVSRRLKNLNRHIDTALNASLGEYKT